MSAEDPNAPLSDGEALSILRGQIENLGWEWDGVSWCLNGSGADHAEILYNLTSNLGWGPLADEVIAQIIQDDQDEDVRCGAGYVAGRVLDALRGAGYKVIR